MPTGVSEESGTFSLSVVLSYSMQMLKEYRQQIIDLGLSEKEADIYLTLLSMGSSTIDALAKETKIKRSTVYVQLKTLLKKGLIGSRKEGKIVQFVAESPNNLKRVLEQYLVEIEKKKAQAESLIPVLLSQFVDKGARPSVRVFEGKEGLKNIRNEVLNMKSKEYHLVMAIDETYNIFSQKELMEFSQARMSKGITSCVLYTSKDKEMLVMPPQEVRRVDRKLFDFGNDVYIFDNKVVFTTTADSIIGIVIESAPVAQTMRSLFKLAWDSESLSK